MHRPEKAASKVAGAAKEVKAMFEGVTGVFKELMREHGEVTALLLRVKGSANLDVRRELFPEIRAELVSHEKGELAEVYPAFLKHESLAGFAERHEGDAGTLERMITRLSAVPYEDASWGPMFDELVEAVARHVKEEENEFFPTASRTLGKATTEAMTPAFEAKKASVMREAQQ